MGFEKFVPTTRNINPSCCINVYGILAFNRASRLTYKLDEYRHYEMFYDKSDKLIGLKSVKDKGRLLRLGVSGATTQILSLLDYYNIKPTQTTHYKLSFDPIENMLVIDLKTGIASTRKKRQDAKKAAK